MKILFICEGNVIRSQMAEAFFRDFRVGGSIDYRPPPPPGTHVPPSREHARRPQEEFPEVVSAMREAGIDMSSATSNRLMPTMLEKAERVILVGPITAGIPPFLRDWPKLEEWGVPDPGYGDIDVREARDMIREKVEALVKELQSP
jgi:protein-tyrosine-phosphatase